MELSALRGLSDSVDRLINEVTVSINLEESLGALMNDGGDGLLSMDNIRMEAVWREMSQPKTKSPALDYLFKKLSTNTNERVIMRLLWGLDHAAEKLIFSPRDLAHAIVCSDHLRNESLPFFRCVFKFLLKLIFFLDYKSNREVFNKSIEKSSQFTSCFTSDRLSNRNIESIVELIKSLLSRDMCLMPAYFAMHELIRSFPEDTGFVPHKCVEEDICGFMDSFHRPARLLYSGIHSDIKPLCGLTPPNAHIFRMDSTNLILTAIKGAMRYPDFLTTTQSHLMCWVLGQLRCTELAAGMLDFSSSKSKSRSVGLEVALVEWIVRIMEITESTDNHRWMGTMYQHVISVVITFMLSSTIRFSEIVVKLNAKLEGRAWPKSKRYIMWFALNATSGFIGKNMLTDFVPCLRLFDILFPDAEDPNRALDLQTVECGNRCEQAYVNNDSTLIPHEASNATTPTNKSLGEFGESLTADQVGTKPIDSVEKMEDYEGGEEDLTSSSAEDSDDENINTILPPTEHRSATCCRRQGRLMHLATAPVCLWQHVLRKSRTGHDHLPRVLPPALRPIEARICYRMSCLVDTLTHTRIRGPSAQIVSQVTQKQLFVILNAFSTDNEASQIIQHLVDTLFWPHNGPDGDVNTPWNKLVNNGSVQLPYGLVAHGRLIPFSNHLVRTMSVHVRMVMLHILLQKFTQLQTSMQLTTPAVLETMCRILACLEVELSNFNRFLNLLAKLQPPVPPAVHPNSGIDSQISPTPDEVSTCYLLATLLDTIVYRLLDILLPEVRLQTSITLVNLLRSWTRCWPILQAVPNHFESTAPNGKPYESATNMKGNMYLELLYLLEWAIIKSARSMHSPDSILYGLCPSLSVTSPNQTGSNQQSGGPLNAPPGGGGSGGMRNSNTGAQSRVTDNSASNWTTSTDSNANIPSATLSLNYPYLMTDYVELNRLTLFSLLQAYHAYELDETSTVKSFVVEQIRTMYEYCGPSSLSDLPSFITQLMPDFMQHIIRQLVSQSGQAGDRSVERKLCWSELPTRVADVYTQIIDGSLSWNGLLKFEDLYYCVIIHYLMQHETIPLPVCAIISTLPVRVMNKFLHQFCDFTVATVVSTSANSTSLHRFLSALLSFCLDWRIVPMDRFVLYLLTHNEYPTTQSSSAVNRILVHFFTQSDKLDGAVHYLCSKFSSSSSAAQVTSTHRSRPCLGHASRMDPLSSRHWPTYVLDLHSTLPDQGINPAHTSVYTPEPHVQNGNCLPVFYGHLLLRLLPILEVILAYFLETNLPLVQLIPFCRSVAPLFRFHRRPMNVCFVLLRNHRYIVPMQLDSPSDPHRQLSVCLENIRLRLITYCLLSEHQQLARISNPDHSSNAGLFTACSWSSVQSTFEHCTQLYDSMASFPGDVDKEVELGSQLFEWCKTTKYTQVHQLQIDQLLDAIVLSTKDHGLYGHPAAWRSWNLEESVCVQTAGVYAAAVEVMSLFYSPSEFVTALSNYLSSNVLDPDQGNRLNCIGTLISILPSAYRMAVYQYITTIFTDPLLVDPYETSEDATWSATKSCPNEWRSSERLKRFANLFNHSDSDTDIANSGLVTTSKPPRASVNFFVDLLPLQTSPTNDLNESLDRQKCLIKAHLWHAVWHHANSTQLITLPQIFIELILPRLSNESQLLMSFYLVGPLMGSLHAERPAKLVDLTAELYRAVLQVDSRLAANSNEAVPNPEDPIKAEQSDMTKRGAIPLIHVDTIADLLYHIKYMYVGNGVLDQVRPILPKLRADLRKRLKFILPPSEPNPAVASGKASVGVGDTGINAAMYEGRLYQASTKPPLIGEDF